MKLTKIKAWDKKSKKMREVASIAFNRDGTCSIINLWGYDIIEEKDIILRREPKEVILLDYIGLKDKNGKEIYEKDILSTINREDPDYKPNMDVTFLNGCFMIGTCNAHEFYRIFQSNPEIIGNIYENPELKYK